MLSYEIHIQINDAVSILGAPKSRITLRILGAGPSLYSGVIVISMLLLGIYILASMINCVPTMLNNLKFYVIPDSNVSLL